MLTLLSVLIVAVAGFARADINSGCPSWGCLPQGTFSYSAGVPTGSNQRVKWSTEIDQRKGSEDDFSVQGCTSDQEVVVCATSRGYVSLDPENGYILWNYTTKSAPYLPVMDIFGDVIGMDQNNLYYIGSDGKPKNPINIQILQPAFSLMLANNSILFITSTSTKTGQVVTYGTDGIVDAAITLTGNVERVNGTFVPCSQPIIAGFRAYLLTQFVPSDLSTKEAQRALGLQRLYAMDVRARMLDRIQVMWYYNLEREDRTWPNGQEKQHSQSTRHHPFTSSVPDIIPPIVMYYRGVIYINNAGPMIGKRSFPNDGQPYPSTLLALKDVGNDTQLLFKTSCMYGPMAAYDTYDRPLVQSRQRRESFVSDWEIDQERRKNRHSVTRETEEGVIWVLNRSPAMISAFSPQTGSIVGRIDVATVSKVSGWVTSKLGVARHSNDTTKDVLVFGMQNSSGEAFLVAIAADRQKPSNAALLFSTKVGGSGVSDHQRDDQRKGSPKTPSPGPTSSSSMYNVAGQIVNVAFQSIKPNAETGKRTGASSVGWNLGIVALVEESGSGIRRLHATAVF